MANKQMKRCFASHVIREIQVETTLYLLEETLKTIYLLEETISGSLTTSNTDKSVKQRELSFIDGGNAKLYLYSGR